MDNLQQAINHIKTGEKTKGKHILIDILRSEPNNEIAWLWMSAAVDDLGQRKQCLEKVLKINPNNQKALTGLSKLRGSTNHDRYQTTTNDVIKSENSIQIDHSTETNHHQTEIVESDPHAKPQRNTQIDKFALQAKLEAIKQEQDLALGILGGLIGGGIGAILWSVITYATEYQIGWMAVGVGFLVGFGIKLLGKGIDKIFGIVGGVISLFSVLFGNFLVSLGFLAKALEIGYIDVIFGFNYSMAIELMVATFSPIDVLFYAIAVYEGYRFSFRKITRAELLDGVIINPKG